MARVIKKENKSKVEKSDRYIERTIEREEKYKALIEDRFPDSFRYISSEIVQDDANRKNYYITVECKHCGEQKTSTYMTFSKSNAIKCMCRDDKAIKKSAEKYAKTLYRSIASEANKLGFIIGDELDEYIRACTLYDRPAMVQYPKYLEYISDYIKNEYKRRKVKQCDSCGMWLSESHMYQYDRRICKECHKENQRKKKRRRMEKEKRKLKGRDE